jgi:hypothetical protein
VIACGGIGDKPVTTSTVKLNEKLVFNDCIWVVLEARDMGKSLKPTDPKGREKTTNGRFFFVRFTASNTSKQGLSLGNPPVPMDNQGRTFGPLDEPERYLRKDVRTDDISVEIPSAERTSSWRSTRYPPTPRDCALTRGSFRRKVSSSWGYDGLHVG